MHFVDALEINDSLSSELEGFHLAEYNNALGESDEELLEALADQFEFPEYFGWNWYAVHDLLCDLRWIEADGHVMLVRGVSETGMTRPLATLVRAWLRAAQEWGTPERSKLYGRDPKPFHLVFELRWGN